MSSVPRLDNGSASGASRQISLKKTSSIEDDKRKLYKAAKDIESLFIYQILKAMRKTIPESKLAAGLGFGSGIGKDIYTEIFDEELAKKMAGLGEKSLANTLYKSLEKIVEQQAVNRGDGDGAQIKELLPKAGYLKVKDESYNSIQLNKKSEPLPLDEESLSRPDKKDQTPKSKTAGIAPDEISEDEKSAEKANKESKERAFAARPPTNGGDTVMTRFGDIIAEAAEKYHLSSELLESVIKAESSGNPWAVSPAGAKGLMQLADTTAQDMGVKDVFNPRENIEGGAKYLRWLIDRFGDLKKALAAYNAGPEAVKRYEGIPPYPETHKYVQTVMDSLANQRHYYE
jgi:Rod binding domain-containing protein